MPFSVLMSDTASAPEPSAAAATACGSDAFGVSLTISGFSVSGRVRSTARAVSAGSAPITSPVSTLGHDTFNSIIATSSHSPTRSTSFTSSSWLKPMTETTSGTGNSASSGRSEARKPSRPLFGRPIELISPAGVSQRRGGGFPCLRRERDRLRHERVEREPLEQLVAERAPGGDRVEGARPVQDRPAQRDPAQLDAALAGQCPLPGDERRLEIGAHPRRARRRTAARNRCESARRSRSMRRSRTPSPTPSRAAPRPRARRRARAPPRASAAARTRTRSRRLSSSSCSRSSSVTYARRPAEPSSVASTTSPRKSDAASAYPAERKPSSTRASVPSSSLQHRMGATPMPPPTRSGRPVGGRREPDAQRAGQPEAVAGRRAPPGGAFPGRCPRG